MDECFSWVKEISEIQLIYLFIEFSVPVKNLRKNEFLINLAETWFEISAEILYIHTDFLMYMKFQKWSKILDINKKATQIWIIFFFQCMNMYDRYEMCRKNIWRYRWQK